MDLAVDSEMLPKHRHDNDANTISNVQEQVIDAIDGHPAKRVKLETSNPNDDASRLTAPPLQRRKGTAPIKAEYLISKSASSLQLPDDDAAESSGARGDDKHKQKQKKHGQNTNRSFGSCKDVKGLCSTRAQAAEFSPAECQFGEKCRFEHDLRKYLKDYKRADLTTFQGKCPVWEAKGRCDAGWKCRFVGSHMRERDTPDGRKELCLVEDDQKIADHVASGYPQNGNDLVNEISTDNKRKLTRKTLQTPKANAYSAWIDTNTAEMAQHVHSKQPKSNDGDADSSQPIPNEDALDNRASFTEPPFLACEKRRIYFGPETPVLAPLTTQGNLPFRRLCVSLGAQVTYSEMAMAMPVIQGEKGEWALIRAHVDEMRPPRFDKKGIFSSAYDNARDLKFGAQITASKPWQALKATEILTTIAPRLRVVDMNCGCPIDLVYRKGAGSALLDAPAKLEKMLRGMNAVSGEVPITVKIRMGTFDARPTATKLVDRLMHGGPDAHHTGIGPAGVAAITLHGRSRQQRYTRSANWEYIAECAALIDRMRRQGDELADTSREPDARFNAPDDKIYFVGNGDCLSHVDYYNDLEKAKVDSVMIGRGALIKPWIFEEIEKGQYLDKSASERLDLIGQYVRYGLQAWGSDEMGIGLTRRFLLEWLSFAYRYVPVGLLEYLPPNIQDRPPAFKGRNELETLLASDNYKDWIKISEMFLGPANEGFRFEPKHKSNSYDIEAEG